ncbi:MAG: DUF11 domain-containing protein [Moraxellaceae bacterium]|nr:DUF11 domain-containing protein [Moraxellaceae bacterium]
MRNQQNNRQACQNTSKVWRLNALAAAMAVAMGGFSAGAFAAAPAANSTIGNTATATYTDASAVPRSATSNTVQTIVQQVGSFTLTADATRYVAPGGQVVYPHTLTNTGNGSDTFNLSAANTGGDDFNFAAFTVYADADGNGVPDNATPVTSATLAAGGVYKFVVVTNAPVTATNAQEGDLIVTAGTTSSFTPVQTATNTDKAIISTNAVIGVTKSANITTGPAGTVVTYTLTYTNTGNTAATSFVLTDTLPKDAVPGTIGTMKYQAGTGVWSGGGALTDDIAGTPNEGTANTAYGTGITYQVMGTPLLGTERIVATIASVAANSSGTVSFQVKIDDSIADGNSIARAGVLSNKAVFDYNNGAAPVTGQQTNIVDFTVTPTASVVANNATGSTADGGANDIVAPNEANVYQGSVVTFNNWIHNTGNSADTFNVTYSNGDTVFANVFPAGTSFQLYQADGVNVLQDTNSDGIPDTGSLAVGGEYKVVLKATLPASYSGAVNYNVTKIARSVTDPTKSNTVTDQLTSIIANVADLSNNLAAGYADGTLGGGAATTISTPTGPVTPLTNPNGAWTITAVSPGATAVFPLFVENKRGLADNYNLAAGSTSGMAALPAGWTATFRDSSAGSCAAMGATITNTGTIGAAGSGSNSKLVCAVISVPANASATPTTPQDIYFKIASPVSNSSDTKLDAVNVNTVRNLQMTTDRTGQVFPGGTVVYEHTLTNNGNVTEGSTAGSMLLTAVNSLSGFGTVLYIDSNSNGVLDGTDRIITTANFETITTDQDGAGTIDVIGTGLGDGLAGLTKGESIRIFAKVQAPAGATPGTTDSLTVTADVVGTINTIGAPTDPVNTDTTNVIGGQIRLDKTQALDAACDGNPDGAGFAASNINALPGACIMYKIIATNEGVSPVTSVVINDATPAFTALFDKIVGGAVITATTPAIVGSGTTNTIPTKPADGATGALIVNVGTLNGTQTGTFTFSVKIDN